MAGDIKYIARPVYPHALTEWIYTATADVCENARDRIACEICDHFSQVTSRLIEEGEERADAVRQAIADLGSPAAARRRFNQSNLLETEVAWLEFRTPMQRNIGRFYGAYFLLSTIVFFLHSEEYILIALSLMLPLRFHLAGDLNSSLRENYKPSSFETYLERCRSTVVGNATDVLLVLPVAFISLIGNLQFDRYSFDMLFMFSLSTITIALIVKSTWNTYRLWRKLRRLPAVQL